MTTSWALRLSQTTALRRGLDYSAERGNQGKPGGWSEDWTEPNLKSRQGSVSSQDWAPRGESCMERRRDLHRVPSRIQPREFMHMRKLTNVWGKTIWKDQQEECLELKQITVYFLFPKSRAENLMMNRASVRVLRKFLHQWWWELTLDFVLKQAMKWSNCITQLNCVPEQKAQEYF